jgi:hypothetical protein
MGMVFIVLMIISINSWAFMHDDWFSVPFLLSTVGIVACLWVKKYD